MNGSTAAMLLALTLPGLVVLLIVVVAVDQLRTRRRRRRGLPVRPGASAAALGPFAVALHPAAEHDLERQRQQRFLREEEGEGQPEEDDPADTSASRRSRNSRSTASGPSDNASR